MDPLITFAIITTTLITIISVVVIIQARAKSNYLVTREILDILSEGKDNKLIVTIRDDSGNILLERQIDNSQLSP